MAATTSAQPEQAKTKAPAKSAVPQATLMNRKTVRRQLVEAGVSPKTFETFPNLDVACAAALEYLAAEILELAGNAAHDDRRVRITQDHVYKAILKDRELSNMLIINTIEWHGAPSTSYSKSLHEVLAQVHPDAGIDRTGVETMAKTLAVVSEALARALNSAVPAATTMGALVNSAITEVYNGELAKHAVSGVAEAIVKLQESQKAQE